MLKKERKKKKKKKKKKGHNINKQRKLTERKLVLPLTSLTSLPLGQTGSHY